MSIPMLQVAIDIAKNKRFQRIAIGAVIGGVVGFAIAKTIDPYIFPEPEFEMLPPYATPERAIGDGVLKLSVSSQMPLNVVNHDGTQQPIGKVTSVETTPTGVTIKGTILPRQKYSKPVNAEAVRPTLQPITPAEHLAALKTIADPDTKKKPQADPAPAQKPATGVSTFSSTNERVTMTGGGDPHKKTRKNPADGE